MEMDAPWRRKAHEIINRLCWHAYCQANPPGRKRHRAYRVPELAQKLIDILGWHDQKAAEIAAKQIFLYEMESAND